ncbi:hypothetical protein BCR42DRAFT_444039 [Absidia repens]|uniref:Uncharacterized protein n=1 Tax=Absidia repens TaxID=90262 RepID=A0A1X2HXJ2_9FUNG|nr:hypothetical protein BCR42DRAFT_444039 [Absidia repens]
MTHWMKAALKSGGYDANGERIIVEIDESKFGKVKYHRGHPVEGVEKYRRSQDVSFHGGKSEWVIPTLTAHRPSVEEEGEVDMEVNRLLSDASSVEVEEDDDDDVL